MRLDLSIWFGQALLSKVTWASCHFRKMAGAIGFEAVNYGSGFKLTPCSSRQNSILAIHVIQFLHPMSLWSRAELVSIFFVYMSNFYRFFLLHHRMKLFVTQICFKHFQESKGQLNQRLRRWLYVIFFQDVLRCKRKRGRNLVFTRQNTALLAGMEANCPKSPLLPRVCLHLIKRQKKRCTPWFCLFLLRSSQLGILDTAERLRI